MSRAEQKQKDQCARDILAKNIRGMRNGCEARLTNQQVRKGINAICRSMIRNAPPRPSIGLSDYFPGDLYSDKHGTIWEASRSDDHGESWSLAILLDGEWDDEDIAYTFGVREYYSGPGRQFSGRPVVQRNGHSTLVRQMGGLDV